MAYVKTYCKKSKIKSNGLAPIYFVIRINNKEKLLFSGKYIEPAYFDNQKEQVRRGSDNSMKLNAYFQNEKAVINSIILDFDNRGKSYTHESIISVYSKHDKNGFVSFCREELEKEKGIISKSTYLQYVGGINNLENYSPGVSIHEIDYDFLRKYEYYLSNVKERAKNGYYHDFATIRKFFKIAIKRGLTNQYPFDNFSFGTEEVEKNWHPENELAKLEKVLLRGELGDKLGHTLAYYLFACYTGLRFGDIYKLSQAMSRGDKERFIFNGAIHLTQGKGKKINRIPLANKAKDLLSNFPFSRPLKQSNSRVNDDLADIMKEEDVKIEKHITFHCSRHTFAINALRKGVTLKALSQFLGHSTARTTEIYAKYSDEGLDFEMAKLNT